MNNLISIYIAIQNLNCVKDNLNKLIIERIGNIYNISNILWHSDTKYIGLIIIDWILY